MPAPDQALAEVALALTGVPAGVSCVGIDVAFQEERQPQRRFGVVPGDSTFVLSRLPVGLVVFSVQAFSTPCAQGAAGEAPTWVGGPVSVTLHPGPNPAISIAMRQVAQATVTVDFTAGAADAGTCSAVGAACASGDTCCSGRCFVDPASSSGIGACAAVVSDAAAVETPASPPPDMAVTAAPSITLDLPGTSSVLLYPVGGRAACASGGATETYVVRTFGNDTFCLDDATWQAYYPVRIEGPALVCTAGSACRLCEDDSCRLDRCLPPAPRAASGCAHAFNDPFSDSENLWVLFKHVDPKLDYGRQPLPGVLNNKGENRTLSITPPQGLSSLGIAYLGSSMKSATEPGDSCDGQSLCGIVPLKAWSSSYWSGWIWSSTTNIMLAPLF